MKAAARHVRRQWLRLQQLPPHEPVPSPCNNVCRIDTRTGFCEGCLRTLDEVAEWGVLDDAERRVVWQRLAARAGDALTPTLSQGERESDHCAPTLSQGEKEQGPEAP